MAPKGGARGPQRAQSGPLSSQRLEVKPLHLELHESGSVRTDKETDDSAGKQSTSLEKVGKPRLRAPCYRAATQNTNYSSA